MLGCRADRRRRHNLFRGVRVQVSFMDFEVEGHGSGSIESPLPGSGVRV